MLNRLALAFAMASSVLVASQLSGTLRPPDLNQLSQEQFQQLLSKALSGPRAPFKVPKAVTGAQHGHCSIPLLESKVNHPERFNMPRLPVGRSNFDAMAMPPAAPACKNWNEGK
jgi:hypothetical protein